MDEASVALSSAAERGAVHPMADPDMAVSSTRDAYRDRVLPEDFLLSGIVVAIFVANLLVSLWWPGEWWAGESIWGTERENGYLLHLMLAFSGLHLFFTPAFLLVAATQRDASDLPPSPALLAWCLAVVAMTIVGAVFTRIPAWRRTVYAILIGMQVSGFAAVLWSTTGQ